MFHFKRKCQTSFQRGCPIFTPANNAHVFYFFNILISIGVLIFLIATNPVVTKWFLPVVLICISLMTNDTNTFHVLLDICVTSFMELSTQLFHEFYSIFVFQLFMEDPHLLWMSTLSDVYVVNI